MSAAKLVPLGIAIIFVGFLVVLAGAFSGSSSTGGFILIGPFPIVFGSGPSSGMLATVGLALTVLVVAFYLVSFFVWRPARGREARDEPNSGLC